MLLAQPTRRCNVNPQQTSFDWDLLLMMVLVTAAIAAVIAALA